MKSQEVSRWEEISSEESLTVLGNCTCIISLNFSANLWGIHYNSHVADENTEEGFRNIFELVFKSLA